MHTSVEKPMPGARKSLIDLCSVTTQVKPRGSFDFIHTNGDAG